MGNSAEKVAVTPEPVASKAPEEKKKLKPCCACPETKRARDKCIMEHGEANCYHLIEAHKQCMRDQGFNI